jgi:hypothetical protein
VRRHSIAVGVIADGEPILRLDPGALPVRYQVFFGGTASEAPAAVMLDREQAVIRQMRGGVPTMVTLLIAQFRGVAARFEPQSDGRVRTTIELAHDDPEMSLPVASDFDSDAMADDWEEWGEVLGLPLLLPVTGDGGWRDVSASAEAEREEAELAETLVPRRARSFTSQRRTRFAKRRKTGRPALRVITGREIIARD